MWHQNYARLNAFPAIDDRDEALDAVANLPGIQTAQSYNICKEAAIINAGNLAVDGRCIGLRANSVAPGPVENATAACVQRDDG